MTVSPLSKAGQSQDPRISELSDWMSVQLLAFVTFPRLAMICDRMMIPQRLPSRNAMLITDFEFPTQLPRPITKAGEHTQVN